MTTPENTPLTPLQKIAVSRKLLEAEILSRAWEDDAFRARLEADPAAALGEAGFPLPEGKTLRILVETSDTVTVVLPPCPTHGQETNDEELASVAGGGLAQNGRCRVYEGIKEEAKTGDVLTQAGQILISGVVSLVGASWGWGG